MAEIALTQDTFLSSLKIKPIPKRYWVALSGGIDSVVLLHLVSESRKQLGCDIAAVHINHNIQTGTEEWQEFCQRLCDNLAIPLTTIKLVQKPEIGDSLEAWARTQRYAAFGEIVETDELLLTGHHQDDQAETVLLQLLRGAGPEGLAAMPFYQSKFGYGVLRPLLNMQRKQIDQYADQHDLNWIQDPSNINSDYDRNYLRNEVLPLIKQRWPAFNKTISRASDHQSEVIELLDELAAVLLTEVVGSQMDVLKLSELKKYSKTKQKLILRYWIKHNRYTVPNEAVLDEILKVIISSAIDSLPVVSWSVCEVRRYRNHLYIMNAVDSINAKTPIEWQIEKPIRLQFGSLSTDSTIGQGIQQEYISEGKISIRYREGGEKIKPLNRNHHHELKKLFQEAAVLPWMRDKIPLIYHNDTLIFVPGLWVADQASCKNNEAGWNFSWNIDQKIISDNS